MKIIRLLLIVLLASNTFAQEVIDTVVATIDNQPITLLDLNKLIKEPKLTSIEQLKNDQGAQQVLDKIIYDKLLVLEAENKGIKVNDDEVDKYFNELSRKNSVTLDQLKAELAKEKINYTDYHKEIKNEILKSRLLNELVRRGPGVSDEQIEKYFEEHPGLKDDGKKYLLSQIFVSKSNRDRTTASAMINEIYQLLTTTDFTKIASKYSESPEGKNGGSLGLLAESELADYIKIAVNSLEVGNFSAPVESALGFHIFKLDYAFSDEEEQIRDKVKELLKQQNMSGEINDFFEVKIFNLHVVEKKF